MFRLSLVVPQPTWPRVVYCPNPIVGVQPTRLVALQTTSLSLFGPGFLVSRTLTPRNTQRELLILEFQLTNDLNGLGPSVPLNIDGVLGTPIMANGVFGAIFDLL